MFEHRRFLLWCLTGLLVGLCLVLMWNFYYTSNAFFPAGTRPVTAEETAQPTLPPLRDTDPMRGSTSTKALRIVEFGDYSCIYCRMAEANLKSVLQEYQADTSFTWRDAPVLNERPDNIIAASAGRCAQEQGVFWPMRDALINSPQLDMNAIEVLARSFMPRIDRFEECLTSGKYIAPIQFDVDLAKKNHINQLPTIFVGKTVLSGLITPSDLQWAIRKELLFLR